jgi:hypothetical protein
MCHLELNEKMRRDRYREQSEALRNENIQLKPASD